MATLITQNKFEELQVHYYITLKKAYEQSIEESEDKEYAKKHFQNIYFIENELIPLNTVLFYELIYTYSHHSKLGSKTALAKTLALLPEIKQIAKKNKNNLSKYLKEDASFSVCDWYMDLITQNKVSSLNDILMFEENILYFTDESLIGSLALYLSGQKLYKEYKESDELEFSKESKHNYSFTRKEQMLAIYFLNKSLGLNLAQSNDRTKIAAFYHLLMGVPFSEYSRLKNTTIYSILGIIPQVVDSDKTLLKYLNKIKPFFIDVSLHEAVKLIDKQILNCESELNL